MRSSKNYQSSEVPWGWVLVSAYGSALLCVGVSQITGPEAVVAFVKDYQTLIAGAATVAALFIAAKQLQRQSRRDAVDAKRHYAAELDAMSALVSEASQVVRASSGSDFILPGTADVVRLDEQSWNRLTQHTHSSIGREISDMRQAIEAYNRLFSDQGYTAFHTFDRRQVNEARLELHKACSALSAKIEERKRVVKSLIDATS